jgi:hypothetical protein
MTHKHHIIPRHEWKVRFGNLDGFNAPDNIANLTVEQHSQAHLLLFELHHRTQDKEAYLGLSGMIGKEELLRRKSSRGGRIPKSLESNEKRRQAALMRWKRPGERAAQRARNLGINNPCYGKPQSLESNQKRSVALMGKRVSIETRKKMSVRQLGIPKKKKAVI